MPRRRVKDSATEGSLPPKRGRYMLRSRGLRLNIAKPVIDDEGRKKNLDLPDFLVLKESKEPGKALNLTNVAVLRSSVIDHHTYDYQHQDIILRRGQPFSLEITFDRNINKKDLVTLEFAYGEKPLESKGTINRLDLDLLNKKKTKNINGWEVDVKDVDHAKVRCKVSTTADSSIGKYRLFTDTRISGDSRPDARVIKEYTDRKFILLFNPWMKADTVYMEGNDEKKEYVMNDTGCIWVGSPDDAMPWNFGQFDAPVLDVTLSLLEAADLPHTAMASPVQVSRTLTSVANSSDNDGVLEGRWTEEWPKNCTLPWEWSGSVEIMKEFYKAKKPVKYGQCWVFSGILTSMCRSVGIPTRSVTNFESAHDTDHSMTIDEHIDEDYDPLEYLDDSIWNFHVWNECWFRRNDLPKGNDGWQLVDGTPQEASEKIMRCGPAPLAAIKEGRVYLNYDVGFAFAEVNGDKILWLVLRDGTMEELDIDKNAVGKAISTKRIGDDNDREDLTLQYKYPEGSKDERRVVELVNQFSGNPRKKNIYKDHSKEEFKVELETPEKTMIGNDFTIGIKVKNLTAKATKARIRATLLYSYYTGVPGKRVATFTSDENIKSHGAKDVSMKVSLKEYKQFIKPNALFKIFVTAKNLETTKVKIQEKKFFLQKPDIMIQTPDVIPFGEENKITVKFRNTTSLHLNNAKMTAEGPGLLETKHMKITGAIKPNQEVTETVIIKAGLGRSKRNIIVSLTTKEISISKSKSIKIAKKPAERSSGTPDLVEDDIWMEEGDLLGNFF